MAENSYHDEIAKQNILKMREVIDTLPSFCRTYFIGIQEQTSARTRLAYAYDLRVFFEYLHHVNPICSKMDITEFKLDMLEQITREDIEEYLEYITFYVKDGLVFFYKLYCFLWNYHFIYDWNFCFICRSN